MRALVHVVQDLRLNAIPNFIADLACRKIGSDHHIVITERAPSIELAELSLRLSVFGVDVIRHEVITNSVIAKLKPVAVIAYDVVGDLQLDWLSIEFVVKNVSARLIGSSVFIASPSVEPKPGQLEFKLAPDLQLMIKRCEKKERPAGIGATIAYIDNNSAVYDFDFAKSMIEAAAKTNVRVIVQEDENVNREFSRYIRTKTGSAVAAGPFSLHSSLRLLENSDILVTRRQTYRLPVEAAMTGTPAYVVSSPEQALMHLVGLKDEAQRAAVNTKIRELALGHDLGLGIGTLMSTIETHYLHESEFRS